MSTNQEMVVKPEAKMSLSARDVKEQVQRIQEMMSAVMKDGEHYGKIPGCGNKPTLLKAGAEKLASTFRLSPDYLTMSETETDDFIAYKVKAILTHIPTGLVAGAGVGTCNSRERKYRNSACWDIQNTLYKMACKRALVAAVLNATAASDIFTQDLEDMDVPKPAPKASAPAPTPAPAKKDENKLPYWTSDFKGKTYMCARVGAHFSEDLLIQLGMKKSQKTDGLYSCLNTPELEGALVDEYHAAEEMLAMAAEKEGAA